MENSTVFSRLELHGWRQFDDIDITLHPRLTVITGANGAGKSTLMSIFARHFGYSQPFLATPQQDRSGAFTYLTGVFSSLAERLGIFKRERTDAIGRLQYSNSVDAVVAVPRSGSITYDVQISPRQDVGGIHVHSHQPVSNYQTVTQIPASMTTARVAYDQYFSEINSRYGGGYSGFSPIYRMKEAILSMAVFGEGNSRSQGNAALTRALDGFVEVLRKILPETLGFLDLVVRSPEIVIRTTTGEFLLDSASGGLITLFDYAWRLHTYSIDRERFVVTMDEPENHLHPSMQRSLMGRLLAAFPNAQFIIATHSPFMVSAVKDCSVYVLRYKDDQSRVVEGFVPETARHRVSSELLDTVNRSASANEILREVLGVPATVPEWVSAGIDDIVSRYEQLPFTVETLAQLRLELAQMGYADQYPAALSRLTDAT